MGKPIKDFNPVLIPLNDAQRTAEDKIHTADWMFLSGPAGTGKTHQAVKMALQAYHDERYLGFRPRKIILSRPTVEAGPRLGMLPGSVEKKMAPWLMAIHDVLGKISTINPAEVVKTAFEMVSFAHMRGRTFDDCIVLIDESQNCTWELLELAYTRLGTRAKMIFTGDHTQSDLLPCDQAYGHFVDSLTGLDSTAVIYFDMSMILRHPKLAEGLNKLREGKKRWQEERPQDFASRFRREY